MGELPRPWCCPEPRCTPVHNLGERAPWIDRPFPGSSFLCFGRMETPVEFVYDGTPHANDLRSCSYTPLKGVVANQENADDWRAISNAYSRALTAIGGWDTPSIAQADDPSPAAGGGAVLSARRATPSPRWCFACWLNGGRWVR